MKCLLCENWSFQLICRECQSSLLKPQIERRELLSGFEVISFYPYSEIKELLHTKHTYLGSAIYKILGTLTMKVFLRVLNKQCNLIPVDDRMVGGYSHTAILAHAARTKKCKPHYRALQAQNRVSYSGKPLAFRLQNPRDFRYSGPQGAIVLIDDIVTTGTTLKEAFSVCQRAGASVLFALVLADAKE